MTRQGNWMQTFTGRRFWPMDPRPEDVDIRDIAHSLALQCRFAGHCRRFYSVAEHSLRASRIVPPEFELWALMHDAAEAYLVDLPRPVKRSMPDYMKAESMVLLAIVTRFKIFDGICWGRGSIAVKFADNTMLATEARDLMGTSPAKWEALPDPLPDPIRDDAQEALNPEGLFLARFYALTE